jgi:hypothetical protein
MENPILQSRMKKLFTEAFTAIEIAEPLLSFDNDRSATDVHAIMLSKELTVIGIRNAGVVTGYALLHELTEGVSGDHIHLFNNDQIVLPSTSFPDIIDKLCSCQYCFVSVLDSAGAVISKVTDTYAGFILKKLA